MSTRRFGTQLSTNVDLNIQHENISKRGTKRSRIIAQKNDSIELPPQKRSKYNLRSYSRDTNNENEETMDVDEVSQDLIIKDKQMKTPLKQKIIPLRRSSRIRNRRNSLLNINTRPIIRRPAIKDCDQNEEEREINAVDYIDEIVNNFRRQEEEAHIITCQDYMIHQSEINVRMRGLLLNWIMEIHRKFKLLDETLYLAVRILDEYLRKCDMKRADFQMTGCASLWLASKYHEIYAPDPRDFVYISDNAFTKAELVDRECDVIRQLSFNVTFVSPLQFAERFLKVTTHPMYQKYKARGTAVAMRNCETYVKVVRYLTLFFCEQSLMDQEVLCRELPSKIAAGALALSVVSMGLYKTWPQFLQQETGYSLRQLKGVIERLDEIRQNKKHEAIRKKYGEVADWFDSLDISFIAKI
jgi:cyclin B